MDLAYLLLALSLVAANGFFVASPFGTSYVPLYGDLRTYGLTLTYAL